MKYHDTSVIWKWLHAPSTRCLLNCADVQIGFDFFYQTQNPVEQRIPPKYLTIELIWIHVIAFVNCINYRLEVVTFPESQYVNKTWNEKNGKLEKDI